MRSGQVTLGLVENLLRFSEGDRAKKQGIMVGNSTQFSRVGHGRLRGVVGHNYTFLRDSVGQEVAV